MTVLFMIVLGIIGLMAILLLLALILEKKYDVKREIIIDKPLEQVFDFVKLMKNQERFNVWVMRDPNVRIDYFGTDGLVGFYNTWQGNKQAGKGEQEIKEVVENKFIKFELRFEEPFKSVGEAYIYTEAITPNQTKVKWVMQGENKFPMTLMNLIIDGLLGKDLEKSLMNLKGIV